MRHFPIFVNMQDQVVLVSGGGACAVAKLRLLMKSEAELRVFDPAPSAQVTTWAAEGKLKLVQRVIEASDMAGATLLYAANDDAELDAYAAGLGKAAGILSNIVDNLEDSDFITPAMVDRAPVTIAIGTEGAAPVLARQIKSRIEEMLPSNLGVLARIGQKFRPYAEALPFGRARRDFWSRFYLRDGPAALAKSKDAAGNILHTMLDDALNTQPKAGFVWLVGAGPGDPELLTLKARKTLHDADVVIHDQLVAPEILELARREATIIETGKRGFGPSWKQEDINALMVEHARSGAQVVRLKSGDPVIYGRLDEEMTALEGADIAFAIVPGITTASAAAASMGQSLTKRGRNSGLRILTGHDVKGFADQDWRGLARDGSTAAIYMGKKAAKFLRGRLMMHGADAQTPITVLENVSRKDQRILTSNLAAFPDLLETETVDGPALILLGLSPREAASEIQALTEEFA